jgi:predicted butyrate kinase (DUF1464 family)
MLKYELTVNMFLVPSVFHVETLPAEFQIEVTDLQFDTDLID